MSEIEQLEARLVELQQERAELEATRTVEDMRKLAEDWIAAALGRMNGSLRASSRLGMPVRNRCRP